MYTATLWVLLLGHLQKRIGGVVRKVAVTEECSLKPALPSASPPTLFLEAPDIPLLQTEAFEATLGATQWVRKGG